jgi:hypothetical protein
VEIDGVYGKGDEIVRFQPSRCACYGGQVGGVIEAVHDVRRRTDMDPISRTLPRTESKLTPPSTLPRTTSNAQCGDKHGALTTKKSDNFRLGRHPVEEAAVVKVTAAKRTI